MQVNSSCSNSPLQWWCSHPALLCSNVESTTSKEQTSSLASLKARWHVGCWTGLSECVVLCTVHSRMRLCGHPCLCTWHYNSDQSWTFWTCSGAYLLCPPSKDTDYIIRKMSIWKIFFVVYNLWCVWIYMYMYMYSALCVWVYNNNILLYMCLYVGECVHEYAHVHACACGKISCMKLLSCD